MFSNLPVAANGEEAWRGASSSHTVWNYSRKLAGKPHPEGITESLLPGTTSHTLPGCWTGRKPPLHGFPIIRETLISKVLFLFLKRDEDGRVKVDTSGYIVFFSCQVKSVKPCLKQLQQCIQTISTLQDDEILPTNPADLFHWLPKEHMCVLVYLVMLIFFLPFFFSVTQKLLSVVLVSLCGWHQTTV